MIPGNKFIKYLPKRMKLRRPDAQLTKLTGWWPVDPRWPKIRLTVWLVEADLLMTGWLCTTQMGASRLSFCPDYIMQTTTPDKRKIDKIIPFVIWTCDRRNLIFFRWFLVQENPQSEPEVAELSKNGLPFIRTVISTCHLGKKLGLMTKVGGDGILKIQLGGVETLKIIY